MWYQPAIELSKDLIIFSIETTDEIVECDFSFQVSQYAGTSPNFVGLKVEACNENGIHAGSTLSSRESFVEIFNNEAKVMHLIVEVNFNEYINPRTTVKEISTNFTINGINMGEKFFQSSHLGFEPSTWNPNDYLIIFPDKNDLINTNYNETAVLYKLSFYDKILDFPSILNLFGKKILNSIPVSWNSTVQIQQNGQIGDQSKNPEFFENPIPNTDLAIINISAFDFDDQFISPNYKSSNPRMKVFLKSFPALGSLYCLNGTELNIYDALQKDLESICGDISLRYRPPLDQISNPPGSVFSGFSFKTQDGISGLWAEEGIKAISIVVNYVNKPPRIIGETHREIVAHKMTKIQVEGKDPDNKILFAFIGELPKLGNVFQISSDSTFLPISENAIIPLTTSSQLEIYYKYNGTEELSSSHSSFIVNDTLKLALEDNNGVRSASQILTLMVHSALKPRNDFIPEVNQNSLSPITIKGEDLSDESRSLQIEIIKPPKLGRFLTLDQAGKYQTFIDSTIPGLISNGSVINGVEILYESLNPHFFSFPEKNYTGENLNIEPESFEFRLKSTSSPSSSSTEDTVFSPTVTQLIRTRNVNDPTEITLNSTSSAYVIYAFSPEAEGDEFDTVAEIDGFKLTDWDLGVDLIKVRIVAKTNGIISLNPEFSNEVFFNHAKYCYGASWQCIGDGTSDTQMVFVGTPAAVERVLNGMTYISLKPYKTENITITLFDGEGGDCFSIGQIESETVFNNLCYKTSINIQVTVLGFTPRYESDRQAITARLQYLALAIIICFGIFLIRYWRAFYNRIPFLKKSKTQENPSNKPIVVYDTLPLESPARKKRSKSLEINETPPPIVYINYSNPHETPNRGQKNENIEKIVMDRVKNSEKKMNSKKKITKKSAKKTKNKSIKKGENKEDLAQLAWEEYLWKRQEIQNIQMKQYLQQVHENEKNRKNPGIPPPFPFMTPHSAHYFPQNNINEDFNNSKKQRKK